MKPKDRPKKRERKRKENEEGEKQGKLPAHGYVSPPPPPLLHARALCFLGHVVSMMRVQHHHSGHKIRGLGMWSTFSNAPIIPPVDTEMEA